MNRILLLALAAFALWPAAPLDAQTLPDPRPYGVPRAGSLPPDGRAFLPRNGSLLAFPAARNADPLAGAFFAPELVMRHQQAIGLTAEQRTAIVGAITAAQPRFIEAQWQLEPETALLAELVRAERVDETRVLQQVDRVLELERQVKRLQLELLVRIKNQLTVEQQRQLTRLGGSSMMRYGPGGANDQRPYGSGGAIDQRPYSPGSGFLLRSGAKPELDGTAWGTRQ